MTLQPCVVAFLTNFKGMQIYTIMWTVNSLNSAALRPCIYNIYIYMYVCVYTLFNTCFVHSVNMSAVSDVDKRIHTAIKQR